MIAIQVKWFLLLEIIRVVTSVNTKCFVCNQVLSMHMCNTTSTCGEGEECFLEQITTASLQVLFNAGCRSKQVCDIMALLGKKRRELVNCAQCCVTSPGASEPCNARLCNQLPLSSSTMSPSAGTGLKCMSCNHALSVHGCKKTTVDCQHNEECYFESVTTPDRKVRFNAGCRSRAVCNLMSSLGPKVGKRDLVNCADCCSDPPDSNGPCNTRLCGESFAPRCLVCDGLQSSTSDCQSTAICPQNQTCYNGVRITSSSSLQYVYGCEEEKTCQAFAKNYHHYHNNQHVGRSVSNDGGIIVCDSCCKDDLCNSNDCFALLKNMTVGMFDPTQMQTGNIIG